MAGTFENPEFVSWAADYLNRKFQEQPWWQRKANTVTTAVSLLVTVGAWVVSQWSGEPWAPALTLIVGFVATVFGVSKTPNGVTARDVRRLEYAAGRAGSLLPEQFAPAETALDAARSVERITAMVEQYRSGRNKV